MPPAPMLRNSTSKPIRKVIPNSSRHAIASMPSSRRPYRSESLCIPDLPDGGRVSPRRLLRLGEEAAQPGPILRALANDAGPARLIGLIEITLGAGGIEGD